MKLRTETRHAAEALGLKIRWALGAVAAILVLERLGDPMVILALGLFAASNALGTKLCANGESYERVGRHYMTWLRRADACGITILGSALGAAGSHLWLLGVPILLTEAMVSRSKLQVSILFGALVGFELAAKFISGFSLVTLAAPVASFAAAAVVGLVLSNYKAKEDVLTSHDRRLATVLDCGATLAASRELGATIVHVLKSSVIETGATCGYVMLTDDEAPTLLRTEAAYSSDGEFEFPQTIEIGTGMSGYVARMGQPVCMRDDSQEEDTERSTNLDEGVSASVKSAVSVPLIARTYNSSGQTSNEQVLGVMTLLSLSETNSFDGDDMEMLRTLASLIAVAVANARMEERQRSTFLLTMESLATALEARDEYTRGHSQRVSELSLMIGEKMGLSAEALEELRVGTVLHDIGKIGVPDSILNKRSALTDDEFEIMKTHPVIGYDICKPLRLSEGVLLIIRNHHEKLDGSGYPDGLKGGELPLSLRIVCAADAFDAMSSRRPYRGVMDPQNVLAELSRCAGTQFDPMVVETLKDLIRTERVHALYKHYWGERVDQKAATAHAPPWAEEEDAA